MTIEQLEVLKDRLRIKFNEMDRLSPSGEEGDAWENALWELEKIEDCLDSMRRSCEDMIFDGQRIVKALDNIGEVIRDKIENPYCQADFI